MDIRPIRTDEDHRAALAGIEAGWWASASSRCLSHSLNCMKRWPVETDESFDRINRYSIEEFGHTQGELGELLGSRSRASEILPRRRAPTVDMIRKISDAWKIPGDLFVRPYHIERAG